MGFKKQVITYEIQAMAGQELQGELIYFNANIVRFPNASDKYEALRIGNWLNSQERDTGWIKCDSQRGEVLIRAKDIHLIYNYKPVRYTFYPGKSPEVW